MLRSDDIDLSKALEGAPRRELISRGDGIDFTSNDYLGIARSESVKKQLLELLKDSDEVLTGATASRLLGGDNAAVVGLERYLSQFHQGESALVFPSGYQTNVTLYSTLPSRHDTIFFDSHVHASIRDGIRLSYADNFSFRHNDVEDLRKKIKSNAKGRVFVAVEALYSMDGDFAPFEDLKSINAEFECNIMVDEAHSTGLYGENGEGLVYSKDLTQSIPIRIHTFGKAIGSQGGCIVGSSLLKEFLVNKGRGFIYSTGIAPILSHTIQVCYNEVKASSKARQNLFRNVELFRSTAGRLGVMLIDQDNSPIQGVLVPGPENARRISQALISEGFFVRPVFAPTVEAGKERIRIVLHSDHKESDIIKLVSTLSELL